VNDAKLTDRNTRGKRQRYIKVQKNDLYLHTPSPGHGEEACYWHANKRLTDEALHMLGKFMTVEVAKYNAYYLREEGVGEYLHHQFEKKQKDVPKANERPQTYTNMSTQELKQIKDNFTMQPFGHQRSEMTNMTKLKEAIEGDKLSDKDKEMAIKQLVALSCSGYGGIGVGLPKTDTKGEEQDKKTKKCEIGSAFFQFRKLNYQENKMKKPIAIGRKYAMQPAEREQSTNPTPISQEKELNSSDLDWTHMQAGTPIPQHMMSGELRDICNKNVCARIDGNNMFGSIMYNCTQVKRRHDFPNLTRYALERDSMISEMHEICAGQV